MSSKGCEGDVGGRENNNKNESNQRAVAAIESVHDVINHHMCPYIHNDTNVINIIYRHTHIYIYVYLYLIHTHILIFIIIHIYISMCCNDAYACVCTRRRCGRRMEFGRESSVQR